jgi:tetratricopeptide (TPR) repeat protein
MTVTAPIRSSCWLTVVAAALVLSSRSAGANDVIHLRQPSSDAVIPVPAVIDDFTGKVIQFRVGNNVRQELTSNVVRIEHKFSEGYDRAAALFNSGNYEGAEAEWKRALVDEPKPWIQREIRSRLVQAALRQDHWIDAANQFLAIVAEDPETFHWSTAPLVWTPFTLRDGDRTTARNWLEGTRPVPRLLGASFLLKDPTLGRSAAQALDGLIRDPSSQVSGLAKAQLWRNRFEQPVSDNEIASWRGHINHLPETLRGGPQYVLASAYRRRRQYDRAAAEFLWVPLLYFQHEPTAARASLEGGETLLQAARREDAIKVLNETVANYAWSAASREAKARLAELQPGR